MSDTPSLHDPSSPAPPSRDTAAARLVAMRNAWAVCFVLVPALLLPVLLIAPEWPLHHLWFFAPSVFGLLLWLRSLWWVGDWIYELAGRRWPHTFPQGADRGFYQPTHHSVLQWMTVAMQAPLIVLGAAMGYGLSLEYNPLIAIPVCLMGSALFALVVMWLMSRIYNSWRYGLNLPVRAVSTSLIASIVQRVFFH